jgi:AcrR family transcriptional regulator
MTVSLKRNSRRGGERLGRDAWVDRARALLVAKGAAAVKIEPLAALLGVTTGSFYWHFKNRQALLDEVLRHWERTNSTPFFDAVANAGDNARAQFEGIVSVWLEEDAFDPAYDSAVRDWARTSAKVENTVRRVDARRIELLHAIFRRLGDREPHALVRARIVYFHQVGYYTLKIRESRAARTKLKATYVDLLLARGAEQR